MLQNTIDRLTRLSLSAKWVTLVLTVLALVAGAVAVPRFNQELLPAIEFPQSIILIQARGLEPEEIRDRVTIPVEESLSGVEGVVNIESTTTRGFAVVIARNEFGLDQETLSAEIEAALAPIPFPEEVEPPQLLNFSFSDLPVISLSASSAELSLEELRTLVEAEIVPLLSAVEDVATVEVAGAQEVPEEVIQAARVRRGEAPPPEPTPEPVTALPLPDIWIQAAASQGETIATTDDLTADLVGPALAAAPQLLGLLTPEMVELAPLEALEAVPDGVLADLSPELSAAFEARLGIERMAMAQANAVATAEAAAAAEAAGGEGGEAVALPESWQAAGASQGITLESTADLTPPIVAGIGGFAPQLLDELTPEMLAAMTPALLAALPADYVAGLDEELREEVESRAALAAESESGSSAPTLPAGFILAGQALGIELNTAADLSPTIMQGVASFAPELLDQLTPEQLMAIPPDSLGWLPSPFIDSLDAELRADLETLAEPVGGLGSAAAAAEEEAAALAELSPPLSGIWLEPPADDPEGEPRYTTAADLINNGFAPTAGEFLNLFARGGQPNMPQFMGDLTPDVIVWLEQNEPGFLASLSPSVLRLFSPEVLSSLPESFLGSIDPALRSELEGIAAGTVQVFVPTDTVNRVNGNPSLGLSVFKDREANTVAVSHGVFDVLAELEADYPTLSFDVAFEQASFIEESISGVAREGGLGALFAVFVILLFLSGWVRGRYVLSWRSTLVTAVSIPLSILMAFALLKWLPPAAHVLLDPLIDATRDVPVAGAIMVAIGRLFPVDVTLNIMTLSGMTVAIGRVVDDSIVVLENIYRHIQRGDNQRDSVIYGTRDVAVAIFASTITTVVVFLPIGLIGGLIGEFFMPFGVAVSYALLSSFLVAVTTVPVLAYLFIRKEHLPPEGETALQRLYTPILKWALRHRALTLLATGLLFAGSLFLLGQRPRAFIPNLGEVQLSVSVDLGDEVTIGDTLLAVVDFEERLKEIEGLGLIQSQVGSGGAGLQAAFGGGTVDPSVAALQIAVEESADIEFLTAEVRTAAADIFGSENAVVSAGTLSSGGFGGFAIVLAGDLETLAEINDEVVEILNGIDGLANVGSNLADASTILRVDGEPALRFTGELESQDALGVTASAIDAVAEILPPGISVSEGFETRQQTEGFAQAGQAVLISIVAVYLVMVLTFGSFINPFTILFSLPMAIIGAAGALWATDRVLGLSAMVGLMMLVGIVVTNAIVLIDRVQANRVERGMSIFDALVEGGQTRLRPILMTAIAAMLALLPLALGFTEGAIIASELATVVIGGLFSSTLLTLLVVPVMYSLLNRMRSDEARPLVEPAAGD